MKKLDYRKYLKTDYWKAVANEVKKRAGWRCQLCNSQLNLQAHHRCYDYLGKDMQHLDELICICHRCHGLFHGIIPQPSGERVKPLKKKGRGNIDPIAIALDMPEGEGDIVLTEDLVERCRTTKNAFTNATLRAFGLKAPLITGWPARLVGKVFTRERYREALEGRYVYGSGRLERMTA